MLLTNAKGEYLIKCSYSPYGQILGEAGGLGGSTLLRYDGQYSEFATGFTYLRARTARPATGQFLSIDPELQATGEPYAYTRDDPENANDLTGQCGCDGMDQASPAKPGFPIPIPPQSPAKPGAPIPIPPP